MTILDLLNASASTAAALYATAIALATVTALAAPEQDQRRDARQVLALLLLRRSRSE